MDRAINLVTKEVVSAFEVYKNGSYQNLAKGEWIAPKDSISNWEEIKEEDAHVHYVKESFIKYQSGKEGPRAPHFSIYPDSKAITEPETKEHKKLKNWLFKKLKENDLEIRYSKGIKPHKYDNRIKLLDLDINWNDYEIEVTTKGTKKLRADILLPFKRKDMFLGNGIIFEIQLSRQGEEQTYERTIERALHGYSVVWLFEKDFIIEEDNIELKENIVNVNSFSEQIHFAKKGFVGKLKIVVEQQCRFLDEKIKETNFEIEKLDKKKEEIYEEIIKRLNTREAILFRKIESLENNPFSGLIEEYLNKINEKEKQSISAINFWGNSKIEEVKQAQPKMIVCPKCKGEMIFKITPKQQKELYECLNCKHIIWTK